MLNYRPPWTNSCVLKAERGESLPPDNSSVSFTSPPHYDIAAYYLKAKQSHPDRNRDDPDANTKFQKIGEAYQVRTEMEKRKCVDLHIATQCTARHSTAPYLIRKGALQHTRPRHTCLHLFTPPSPTPLLSLSSLHYTSSLHLSPPSPHFPHLSYSYFPSLLLLIPSHPPSLLSYTHTHRCCQTRSCGIITITEARTEWKGPLKWTRAPSTR